MAFPQKIDHEDLPQHTHGICKALSSIYNTIAMYKNTNYDPSDSQVLTRHEHHSMGL